MFEGFKLVPNLNETMGVSKIDIESYERLGRKFNVWDLVCNRNNLI